LWTRTEARAPLVETSKGEAGPNCEPAVPALQGQQPPQLPVREKPQVEPEPIQQPAGRLPLLPRAPEQLGQAARRPEPLREP
jgi:hypothetical protein